MKHNEISKRNTKMVSLIINGASIKQVADEFKVTISTVYNVCKQLNITIRKDYHGIPPTRSFMILKELFTDKTMTQIAQEFGITHQRVSQVYKQAKLAEIPGLPIRS